ncbi:MAG: hypothetical protein ACR2MC_00900 [Actinomycetota bacterium]
MELTMLPVPTFGPQQFIHIDQAEHRGGLVPVDLRISGVLDVRKSFLCIRYPLVDAVIQTLERRPPLTVVVTPPNAEVFLVGMP